MIPQEVKQVLHTLNGAGYEAFVVGGCVRDILRGVMPHDWDITTSALPEETMALFPHFAIPTGLKHGTVTVLSGSYPCEVTTYRADGEYTDHRRPDGVTFTRSLREDLARRDFTVNAMAMDETGEVVDPFGGREDLRAHILRCVGEPAKRFSEDALRILRALRFAATLGFSIEYETKEAIFSLKDDLHYVAAERVREEITKLLLGDHSEEILTAFPTVLGVVISVCGIGYMLSGAGRMEVMALVFAIASGVTSVFSRLTNARLSDRTSALGSTFTNHWVGLVGCIVLLLVAEPDIMGTLQVTDVPVWAYFGGLCGVVMILMWNIASLKVSAFRLTLLSFIGQVFTGIVLDLLIGNGFSMQIFVGGMFVVAGVLLNMMTDKKEA